MTCPFVMLCIDGNGYSHVVASFLVHHEDEVTVREMGKVFKAKNPASEDTSVIVTDKDMTERGIFKTELPDIVLQICLFHILRTFSREVTRLGQLGANISPDRSSLTPQVLIGNFLKHNYPLLYELQHINLLCLYLPKEDGVSPDAEYITQIIFSIFLQ